MTIRNGTIADISDDELLRRAVKGVHGSYAGQPRWSAIMDRFALGSTYAAQLCRRFGFDPDEVVRR